MSSFKVVMVQADSNHPMAKQVEDEEQLFVVDIETNTYYETEDFFYVTGIKQFETGDI